MMAMEKAQAAKEAEAILLSGPTSESPEAPAKPKRSTRSRKAKPEEPNPEPEEKDGEA